MSATMSGNPLLVMPLLIAVVVIVSGVQKVRTPKESAQAFSDLRIPQALRADWIITWLPWLEIVAGIGVLVLPRPGSILVTLGVLGLMIAYTVVIARALGFEAPVTCNCFGATGATTVTERTLVRNIVLVVVAVGALMAAIVTPGTIIGAWITGPAFAWGWLLAVVVSALTAVLITADGAPERDREQASEGEVGDYLRLPIPFSDVTLGDGTATTLRQMTSQSAHLLVFVSPGCGPCEAVLDELPSYRQKLGPVTIRLVTEIPRDRSELDDRWDAEMDGAVDDVRGEVSRLFDVIGNPTAVLLGADGFLAGGPVAGRHEVDALVDQMAAQLAESPTPDSGTGQADTSSLQ